MPKTLQRYTLNSVLILPLTHSIQFTTRDIANTDIRPTSVKILAERRSKVPPTPVPDSGKRKRHLLTANSDSDGNSDVDLVPTKRHHSVDSDSDGEHDDPSAMGDNEGDTEEITLPTEIVGGNPPGTLRRPRQRDFDIVTQETLGVAIGVFRSYTCAEKPWPDSVAALQLADGAWINACERLVVNLSPNLTILKMVCPIIYCRTTLIMKPDCLTR